MRPKTSAADPRSDLDKFVDGLDNLPLHTSATKIEAKTTPGSTSSSVAATSLGLDSFQSKNLRNQSQLGSRNVATDLQEANVFGSLYALEKDLDSLLQARRPKATTRREASGCFGASDMMITSVPDGRIVHWRGMALSDLLETEGRLVAHLETLPFQEGRPLATVVEESTELVDTGSDELASRQVLMAEEGEDDGDLHNVNFETVSEDEITANAGDENDADREARRARNRARTIRRRRASERRRSMHRKLDPEFAAVSERGFRTPVANIARVTAILERSHDPDMRQALLYAQRAWIQLDQHNRRPPSGRSAWVKVGARLTAERLAAVLDTSSATTTLAGARPLAGGSSHRKRVIRDRPIIDFLKKTCASTSMRVATRGP
jgi:hypothetical protein